MNLRESFLNIFCMNCRRITELEQTISEISLKNKALSKENEAINKTWHFNESKENISYITNHNGNMFIITCKTSFKKQKSKIKFKGYDLENHKKDDRNSRSFIFLRCIVNYDENGLKRLYICDFSADSNRRNAGYGSIMLKHLIEYAKLDKIDYIEGVLSFVDIGTDGDESKKEDRERLYYFYPKHGFFITEDKKIYLHLKSGQKE